MVEIQDDAMIKSCSTLRCSLSLFEIKIFTSVIMRYPLCFPFSTIYVYRNRAFCVERTTSSILPLCNVHKSNSRLFRRARLTDGLFCHCCGDGQGASMITKIL